MKIKECYIESFGKIKNKKFEFKDGVNCIKGDNGSGKTTLAAFIKAMLYGIGDSKKQSTLENERRRYLPWDGSIAKGSLTFSAGGKEYRVERSFGQKPSDDSFAIYDTALGRVSEDYTRELGTELFGIDADGFERTVFLSERQLSQKSPNQSISAKLSNLVGCDGDIGGLDAALKALEDQRRAYKKKGGRGEIADIEEEISDCRARLEELSVKRGELKTREAALKRISSEIDTLKTEAGRLLKEREGVAIKAAQSDYKYRIAEYNEKISSGVKKKDKLMEFFRGAPPTHEEIDNAYYKATEARNTIESERMNASDSEYATLRAYFDGRCERGEIDEIKSLIKSVRKKEEIKDSLDYKSMKELFARRIPEKGEIDAMIRRLQTTETKRTSPLAVGLSFIGAALTIGSLILGFAVASYFLVGAAVGISALAVGIFLILNRARKEKRGLIDELASFYSSFTDMQAPALGEALLRLREVLSKSYRAREIFDSQDTSRELLKINAFSEKFGLSGDDVTEVERIIEKYERYSTAKIAESLVRGERDSRLARAARYKSEAEAFVAKFKVTGEEPFTEIRNQLIEYERVSEEIINARRELTGLTNLQSFGEIKKTEAELMLEGLDKSRTETDEQIAALTRELAVTERGVRELISELDREDELKIRLAELSGELSEKEKNLETILLTKEYLMKAKDNMTSRYLGKTKKSFKEYAELISGRSGEYEMSTDFEVSKIEGALTYPAESYSRGTRDLYDIAMRLSLIDSLYENESPFIIFDDPFAALDDARLRAVLKLLSTLGKNKQIIYFTCQSARAI